VRGAGGAELRPVHRALGELLDRLAGEDGPLNSVEDEAEIARYVSLLSDSDVRSQ